MLLNLISFVHHRITLSFISQNVLYRVVEFVMLSSKSVVGLSTQCERSFFLYLFLFSNFKCLMYVYENIRLLSIAIYYYSIDFIICTSTILYIMLMVHSFRINTHAHVLSIILASNSIIFLFLEKSMTVR